MHVCLVYVCPKQFVSFARRDCIFCNMGPVRIIPVEVFGYEILRIAYLRVTTRFYTYRGFYQKLCTVYKG